MIFRGKYVHSKVANIAVSYQGGSILSGRMCWLFVGPERLQFCDAPTSRMAAAVNESAGQMREGDNGLNRAETKAFKDQV